MSIRRGSVEGVFGTGVTNPFPSKIVLAGTYTFFYTEFAAEVTISEEHAHSIVRLHVFNGDITITSRFTRHAFSEYVVKHARNQLFNTKSLPPLTRSWVLKIDF